jgi:RluA family pseudouridine synthase
MSIPINIPDHILFEDDVILVIHKPAGLMVEPDRNGHPNLLQAVKKYLQLSNKTDGDVYAQHIHRLDRPVSGVILFAKDRSVLKNLSEQFAERRVKKLYRALTSVEPIQKSGTLEQWHRKEKKKAKLYENEIAHAEKAKLTYEVSKVGPDKFLWTIKLHTGKYHQIRAQLAYLGCPILGDELYGAAESYPSGSIALQAYLLQFHHPLTDQEMTIELANSLLE